MAFYVKIDEADSRVLVYFESTAPTIEAHLSFPDVASAPGWDDAAQLSVGQKWDGEKFVPRDDVTPPTHRLEMSSKEFNSLFLPGEYRNIKKLRNLDPDGDAEIVDQLWDAAELPPYTVDMRESSWSLVSEILVRRNCVSAARMDVINLGYPL